MFYFVECNSEIEVLPLPTDTSCHITNCTMIECCFPADILQRNVHAFINTDSCKYTLTVGIEKLQFTVDLFAYNFGAEQIVAVEGVFSMRYDLFCIIGLLH